ncbi:uncharacterized protein PV09_09816 [Verruconis gallopava]|uniref:Clr5 domain-containing protein n=1 Tax=Verruconis gallopava TaxID=253628 RepID=A0A0D1YCC1_9PEZI|nr:uncharacterized protein PV09_09816 [Verruconis gallopava]KIV98341.1 hypothetical protein PV09_09816 [Verruconis gallopava]
MPRSTEFIISAGSGIRLLEHQDLEIGAVDKDLSPADHNQVDKNQKSQGVDDDRNGDKDSRDSRSQSTDDQNEHGQIKYYSQTESVDNNKQFISLPVGMNGVAPTPCGFCKNIREKINTYFESRKDRLRKYQSVNLTPGEFFGNTTFASSLQWSFKALADDAANLLNRERAPFHKINLTSHLQELLAKSKISECNFRKSMLQELYPGFKDMTRKERNPLYRKFERSVEQGKALFLISSQNPGILLTIAGCLSREELRHLSKDWKTCAYQFPWLSSEILQFSKQYEGVVRNILVYMQCAFIPGGSKGRASANRGECGHKRLRLDFPQVPNEPTTTTLPEWLPSNVCEAAESDSINSTPPMMQTQRAPALSIVPLAINDLNCNGGQRFIMEYSGPTPSLALSTTEYLFHIIKIYVGNTCRNMKFNDHGTLLNSNGSELRNDLCDNFDSYCFTATILASRALYVGFRATLSKAFALVEEILQAEHPRTLTCFLEVLIHLIQTGHYDVSLMLRDYIKNMSAKVTRKGSHWGEICRLLGKLDSDSVDQAMAKVWECTVDSFDSNLEPLSRLAVSIRLDYIKRVYGATNCAVEEQLLRSLLAKFKGSPKVPTPRVMLNLAHNLNRQGRYVESEKMALDVLSLLKGHEIYTKRNVERIECMKIISHSQFYQGKILDAENTMRLAICMVEYYLGEQHSWVLEFKNVLEGWLRQAGRREEANILRRELQELTGEDEIDKRLDRV